MPLAKMTHAQTVLHDDVISEILSWLPVKSLLRFRCVCKSWKSLISHPHFVKLHLHRSPKNVNLILTLPSIPGSIEDDFSALSCSKRSLVESPSSTITATDHYYRLKDKYCVLGSCNGLVCLHGSCQRRYARYWVRFWNPAMRLRSRKSPCLCVDLCSNQVRCTFGFGYDGSSDAYKVVAVIAFKESKTTEAKVYTMGDHCWRDIERFPAFPVLQNDSGKYLSGTLNWLAAGNFTINDWGGVISDELVIVSLDLGKEIYKHLSLPVGINRFDPSLGVLGDCLCLFHECGTRFVVWQMKEFGVEKSWTQFVNLSYQQFRFVSLMNPVCMLEDGVVLLLLYFEAILYNQKNNTVERRFEFYRDIAWMDATDYVESLILPCWN